MNISKHNDLSFFMSAVTFLEWTNFSKGDVCIGKVKKKSQKCLPGGKSSKRPFLLKLLLVFVQVFNIDGWS